MKQQNDASVPSSAESASLRTDPSFSVPEKQTAHIRFCVRILSVRFLPIHHTAHYAPHLDVHQTSHVQLRNPSRSRTCPAIG